MGSLYRSEGVNFFSLILGLRQLIRKTAEALIVQSSYRRWCFSPSSAQIFRHTRVVFTYSQHAKLKVHEKGLSSNHRLLPVRSEAAIHSTYGAVRLNDPFMVLFFYPFDDASSYVLVLGAFSFVSQRRWYNGNFEHEFFFSSASEVKGKKTKERKK